jgi:hypothetical protein
MDVAAVSPAGRKLTAEERLLARCIAIDEPEEGRRPAADERLETLLGREFACRLVRSLTGR